MIDFETFEMFLSVYEQSPFAGIIAFLAYFVIYASIALVITFLFFSIFPVLFALLRKKPIKRKRFRVFCYCINIIAFVGNALLGSGVLTIAGYIMWTMLGCLIGVKILKRRGKLLEEPPPDKPEE